MKTCSILLVLLVFALLAAGCATPGSPAASPAPIAAVSFPLNVTDDVQRQVGIKQEPQRIVSLAPSNTELIYALGLQDRLVGVDDYSDYPPEAKNKEKVGGFAKPSIEKVVSLAPDLVVAANIHLKTVVPELEKQGLTVVVFQPPVLEKVLDNLLLLGKIGNRPGAAEKLVADLKRRIEIVTTKTKGLPTRPRVFFELSPDLITVGRDTFIDDMISKAGGENIARDAQGAWPKLNPESIVAKDPEVIVLSDHGSAHGGVTVEMVKQRPGWAVITAVRNGRIVPVENVDIINRSSHRAVDGLEFLARTIHPEVFR